MFKSIYEILTSILGESKQGYYDKNCSQYQFNCPWETDENGGVPDNKYNLEVSFEKFKFHAWCCNNAGPISRIIKVWGSKSLLDEYYRIISELKESKYLDPSLFKDDGSFIFEDNLIRLPKTFTKIDLATCKKKKLVEYLQKRKITQDIIDFYNIGYTTWEEEKWQLRDRVIIPSYNVNGDLNYWVGRDFMPPKPKVEGQFNFAKMKYWNCDADKKKIVLHEDKIQWDADIVLVEGAVDCVYYHNAIGMMGKALSKDNEIYIKLKERSNGRIIICLDADTDITETKRLYRLLNVGRLKNRIWYIRLGNEEMPYKDFGEIYEAKEKEGIIECLKTAKQFNEIDLLI